jgi:hypothetical protein
LSEGDDNWLDLFIPNMNIDGSDSSSRSESSLLAFLVDL